MPEQIEKLHYKGQKVICIVPLLIKNSPKVGQVVEVAHWQPNPFKQGGLLVFTKEYPSVGVVSEAFVDYKDFSKTVCKLAKGLVAPELIPDKKHQKLN